MAAAMTVPTGRQLGFIPDLGERPAPSLASRDCRDASLIIDELRADRTRRARERRKRD
jgi:hypothetical protein